MEPMNPLLPLLVVICLLIFIAALVAAIRGKAQSSAVRWLMALVALSGLVTLLTLSGIILTTLSNGTLIGFCIPGAVALVRFLPLVAAAFGLALTVLAVARWLRPVPGAVRSMIFTSLVAVAGLFISGWLLSLGFRP
jgi:hypothetical protein